MKNFFFLLFIPSILLAEAEVDSDEKVAEEEIAFLEPTYLAPQPSITQESIDSSSFKIYQNPRKNAFWAATLSGLIPGLGHVYLGDYKMAGVFLGSYGIFGGLGLANLGNETFRSSNLITLQNLGFYSAYAAYRDTRAYNHFEGYNYSMPTDSFAELALAPFQWKVIKKPEVWGGVLGALSIGFGLSYFIFSDDLKTDCNINLASSNKSFFPLMAFPIGLGEEAFFRGYLQSLFAESLTPWGGIALSSLCFGAMHTFNALEMDKGLRKRYFTYGIPLITSFGAYFGWLTYKNHSLKESVAMHTWYDFTLFLLSYSVTASASIGMPSFAFSFSF